eukprot:6487254-Ditylum_brightwellii.AAC.1
MDVKSRRLPLKTAGGNKQTDHIKFRCEVNPPNAQCLICFFFWGSEEGKEKKRSKKQKSYTTKIWLTVTQNSGPQLEEVRLQMTSDNKRSESDSNLSSWNRKGVKTNKVS